MPAPSWDYAKCSRPGGPPDPRLLAAEARSGLRSLQLKAQAAFRTTVAQRLPAALLELDLSADFRIEGPFAGAVVRLSRWIAGKAASSAAAAATASASSFVDAVGAAGASLLVPAELARSLGLYHSGGTMEVVEEDEGEVFVDVGSGDAGKTRASASRPLATSPSSPPSDHPHLATGFTGRTHCRLRFRFRCHLSRRLRHTWAWTGASGFCEEAPPAGTDGGVWCLCRCLHKA